MTRKHFERVADDLLACCKLTMGAEPYYILCRRIAESLKAGCPTFDQDKFLKACAAHHPY